MSAERNRRVLIVDDDAAIRMLLSKVLQHEDFASETAADGEEALRKIESEEFEVIILDLMMPRMNGHEVIDHLKQEHPEMLSRVIVLSAAPTREVRQEPVYAVISKPFELTSFRSLLHGCAGGAGEEMVN
jgi:CheY-like chemotaxis protein